jgi:hypothetical protein
MSLIPFGFYKNSNSTFIPAADAFDISIMRLYKCELTQEQVIRNFNLEKSRYGL